MLYLSILNQITNRVGIITLVHQHTINTIKGQKLVTLLEVLCSREKGSEAEQQPILQELNVSKNTSCTFVVGIIKYFYNNWKNITNDRFVPDIVKYGLKMEFQNKAQLVNIPKIPHYAEEKGIINLEINSLFKKGVITKCQKEEDDFISTAFIRKKMDGTFRTILKSKYVNEFVEYKYFKMKSLEDVFKIIKKDVWMASVDLKDAFFTIPVHILHQKYFKFEWFNQFYKFLGMPNGYSDAMRIFTEMLKPFFGYLRKQGHLSIVIVDDSYLQADAEQDCVKNINVTVNILHLSAHPSDIQTFHQKLQMLSWSCGDQPQGQDMSLYSEDGTALRYEGMRLPILQM